MSITKYSSLLKRLRYPLSLLCKTPHPDFHIPKTSHHVRKTEEKMQLFTWNLSSKLLRSSKKRAVSAASTFLIPLSKERAAPRNSCKARLCLWESEMLSQRCACVFVSVRERERDGVKLWVDLCVFVFYSARAFVQKGEGTVPRLSCVCRR